MLGKANTSLREMSKVLSARSTLAKFLSGLPEMDAYRFPDEVVPTVVYFDGHGNLRLVNTLGTQIGLKSFDSLLKPGQYAEDLRNPESLEIYTKVATGCKVDFVDMVEFVVVGPTATTTTVYVIYLATGRVNSKGYDVNLTHGQPGRFFNKNRERIMLDPVAAALFNRRD